MAIPINVEDLLNKRKIESNRRLGDYLKELQLSEGRATGYPYYSGRTAQEWLGAG